MHTSAPGRPRCGYRRGEPIPGADVAGGPTPATVDCYALLEELFVHDDAKQPSEEETGDADGAEAVAVNAYPNSWNAHPHS